MKKNLVVEEYTGTVYEGGQEDMYIDEGKRRLSPGHVVNRLIKPFEDKKIRMKVTVEIEVLE